MLYAAGVPDEDTMQNAPHVGIASVWWEGNPCNMHREWLITKFRLCANISTTVLDLAKEVKISVKKQGFLAWQYNTIGVSDGITMGSEGSS